MEKRVIYLIVWLISPYLAVAQNWQGKFEQLGTTLPTPNSYRTASGAPGEAYWQQKADYKIDATLDEDKQTLTGSEIITYTNNSPDQLNYLWIQLDQNIRAKDSQTPQVSATSFQSNIMTAKAFKQHVLMDFDYDGGFKLTSVKDSAGTDMRFIINHTMMRLDLVEPLKPGQAISFSIDWWYNMYDRMLFPDARGGYEYFPEDGNYDFTLAQWYPRMAVYDDVEGWQNKQFLGEGEFALTFGDFMVNITVPSDHIVAATGWLQNPEEVLTPIQYERFKEAQNSEEIIFIVNEKEARKNEKTKAEDTKTWKFKAENVRDFAFTSSRKYIWDAVSVPLKSNRPLAMSFYPKEANPLWEEHSTGAVANTLRYYSQKTIDYPYPVAISVHSAEQGMEYPMICFNYGRPDEKGRYSELSKQDLVSVVVHEVGHNFFPMIINSDERQWTWMDEGLNTLLEHYTIAKYYPGFDHSWGTPQGVTEYMKGDKSFMRPTMTNPEQLLQSGYNAYGKPSAALVILRESIMGEELFDKAFKEYAERWAFKQPTPADFFRTMEDASAVDLDWFWRGWFYSVDNVDVELSDVRWFKMNTQFRGIENTIQGTQIKSGISDAEGGSNSGFSVEPEPLTITDTDSWFYGEFRNRMNDDEVRKSYADKNFYELTFKNIGGLVTPLIIEWTYKDGTKEVDRIPAEIWRLNETEVKKVFMKDREVVHISIDPNEETADTDVSNNFFPKHEINTRWEKFRESQK